MNVLLPKDSLTNAIQFGITRPTSGHPAKYDIYPKRDILQTIALNHLIEAIQDVAQAASIDVSRFNLRVTGYNMSIGVTDLIFDAVNPFNPVATAVAQALRVFNLELDDDLTVRTIYSESSTNAREGAIRSRLDKSL